MELPAIVCRRCKKEYIVGSSDLLEVEAKIKLHKCDGVVTTLCSGEKYGAKKSVETAAIEEVHIIEVSNGLATLASCSGESPVNSSASFTSSPETHSDCESNPKNEIESESECSPNDLVVGEPDRKNTQTERIDEEDQYIAPPDFRVLLSPLPLGDQFVDADLHSPTDRPTPHVPDTADNSPPPPINKSPIQKAVSTRLDLPDNDGQEQKDIQSEEQVQMQFKLKQGIWVMHSVFHVLLRSSVFMFVSSR